MKKQTHTNRRHFLKTGTAAMAVLPAMMPATVLGANERVNLGIIGPGGRGRGLMREFLHFDTRFVAVCDAYRPNAESGLQIAGSGAKDYDDFRKLLDDKNVDAVVIATPEHQHGVQLTAAVRAGKDVYCEKPMSHSIEEGVEMVKAVRATDRIVQIGMQRRSSPAIFAAKEIIDQGKLGDIFLAKAEWNWQFSRPMADRPLSGELNWEAFCYPSPVRPFDAKRYQNWRVFWDYSGGHVCDQGTHLMDVIQWFTGAGTPRVAECFGRVYRMTGAETPDVFSAIYEYKSMNVTWTLCYTNPYQNGWTITFLGDRGTLVLDGNGSRFYEDIWEDGAPVNFDTWDSDRKPDWEFSGPLPTLPHVENFLECMKSRKEPNAPVEVGHSAVSGPHLANVAWHNKRRAHLSADAAKVTVG